jgi:hypothetical protein
MPVDDLTKTARAREAHLGELAERLEFTMEKAGGCFATRSADLSRPERRENLTLDQVEHLLDTWQLRGLGGG